MSGRSLIDASCGGDRYQSSEGRPADDPPGARRVLADVKANEDFLKEKGMEFVEVDKAAFAKIAQPVVEGFFKDQPDVLALYKKITEME